MSNEQLAISNDSQTRKMKYSGVEWIGNIPEEWSLSRFKDHYKNVKEIAGENASEYERLALTLNGVIKRAKDDSEGLQPKAFDSYQILRENDFIFKMIDLQNISTSRVGLSPYTGLVSPAYIRFTPRKEKQNNKFTYYFLMSMYYNCVFNNLGGDGVRSALNASDMGVLIIPFPSKKEQQTIADILDRKCTQIDALIANEEQQIAKLKAYKQSVITETVTKGLDPDVAMKDSGVEYIGMIPYNWEIISIGIAFRYVGGYAFKSDLFCNETNYQVLRLGNVKNDMLILDDKQVFVSEDYAKQAQNCEVTEDDILFTMTGTKGKKDYFFTLLVKPDNLREKHLFINQRVGLFRKKYTDINMRYYNYLLKEHSILNEIFLSETGTANQGNLGIETISRTKLHLPPMEEQQAISDYLDKKCSQIDRLIAIKQQKIEKLQQYKKSLIYEYVTGKREVELCCQP